MQRHAEVVAQTLVVVAQLCALVLVRLHVARLALTLAVVALLYAQDVLQHV